jgi:nucleosome binding factor SPN SPT16 subunit
LAAIDHVSSPVACCFVQPPFVLTLSEVERAHFERAGNMNRNFDLVFIFTDYKRQVSKVGIQVA